MTPTQYNKPLHQERPRKMYYQLPQEHKEVVSLMAELYIQKALARGEKVEQYQKFDLYNYLSNKYSDADLDEKHKELSKNRQQYSEQQRYQINNSLYNPIGRN